MSTCGRCCQGKSTIASKVSLYPVHVGVVPVHLPARGISLRASELFDVRPWGFFERDGFRISIAHHTDIRRAARHLAGENKLDWRSPTGENK